MTDGLKRIGIEVRAFSEKVAQCQDKDNSTMPDIQDAYSRLHRCRDRYEHEVKERSLDRAEMTALRKVFEKDNFILSMLNVRQIGDHVLKRGGATLYRADKSSFEITSRSSAAVVFADRCPRLEDVNGESQPWDHPKNLAEAERRISRAYDKAKSQ